MKEFGGLETTYSNILLRMKVLKYNITQLYQNGYNVSVLNKNFAFFKSDFNKICNNSFAYDAEENRPLSIALKKSLKTIANEFQKISDKADNNSYASLLTRDGQTVTLGIYFDLQELGIFEHKNKKQETEMER